jgi:translation elongation factor aEF-1 beta
MYVLLVRLKVQTRMARVIITFTIMPVSPEVDFAAIEEKAKQEITAFAGETEFKVELKPVAFGLKSLNVIFVMDEDKGSTEELEKKISGIEGVNSCEVSDVRRTIG